MFAIRYGHFAPTTRLTPQLRWVESRRRRAV